MTKERTRCTKKGKLTPSPFCTLTFTHTLPGLVWPLRYQKNPSSLFSWMALHALCHSEGPLKTAFFLKHNNHKVSNLQMPLTRVQMEWTLHSDETLLWAGPLSAESVQHKIAFLANGSALNNVKWDCNDFETRPGAIDRLSQWKGSLCFDREQASFHRKWDWVCRVSIFISELAKNRQLVGTSWHLSLLLFGLFWVYLHTSNKCLCMCMHGMCGQSKLCVCLALWLGNSFFGCRLEILSEVSRPLLKRGFECLLFLLCLSARYTVETNGNKHSVLHVCGAARMW